ncbi:hypothetical protein RsTz2092_13490 [Deferribacterales bacterium RsTz2092]
MLTNLDLIWSYTKELAERLTSSPENMQSVELTNQYYASFEQLMQIIENPEELKKEEVLEDIRLTINALHDAYVQEENRLRAEITIMRKNQQLHHIYLMTMKDPAADTNYNKEG